MVIAAFWQMPGACQWLTRSKSVVNYEQRAKPIPGFNRKFARAGSRTRFTHHSRQET
jgi:hypothetical protein